MLIETGLNTIEVLVFTAEGRNYAIRLDAVREITRMVLITKAPETPEFVEGVVNLRGDIVPVIDFRKRLKLTPKEHTLSTPIVFVGSKSGVYGIVVDKVMKVAMLKEEDIAEQHDDRLGHVEGVAKYGDDIVFIIDADRLQNPQGDGRDYEPEIVSQEAAPVNQPVTYLGEVSDKILKARSDVLGQSIEETMTDMMFNVIAFSLGPESYVIKTDDVMEVFTADKITMVPGAHMGMAGVINLRGEIVSIIDVAKIIGIEARDSQGLKEIVIVSQGDKKHGLLVGQIAGIKNLEGKTIQMPMETFEVHKAEYIEGEVNINGTIMALLKVQAILDSVRT